VWALLYSHPNRLATIGVSTVFSTYNDGALYSVESNLRIRYAAECLPYLTQASIRHSIGVAKFATPRPNDISNLTPGRTSGDEMRVTRRPYRLACHPSAPFS
jgi:hypothetical protein